MLTVIRTIAQGIARAILRLDPDLKLAAGPIKGDYCSGCCRCDHCNGIERQMVARKRALKRYGDNFCTLARLAQRPDA